MKNKVEVHQERMVGIVRSDTASTYLEVTHETTTGRCGHSGGGVREYLNQAEERQPGSDDRIRGTRHSGWRNKERPVAGVETTAGE